MFWNRRWMLIGILVLGQVGIIVCYQGLLRGSSSPAAAPGCAADSGKCPVAAADPAPAPSVPSPAPVNDPPPVAPLPAVAAAPLPEVPPPGVPAPTDLPPPPPAARELRLGPPVMASNAALDPPASPPSPPAGLEKPAVVPPLPGIPEPGPAPVADTPPPPIAPVATGESGALPMPPPGPAQPPAAPPVVPVVPPDPPSAAIGSAVPPLPPVASDKLDASPAPQPVTPPAPIACPWTLRMAIVDGRTQVEARIGKEVQFRVQCLQLDLQAPRGSIQAQGDVKVSGSGLDGTCQRLTINWQDDHVLLEGGAQLKCLRDGQDVELRAERLSLRLSASSTIKVEGAGAVKNAPAATEAATPSAEWVD